jgi:hypothetical protein
MFIIVAGKPLYLKFISIIFSGKGYESFTLLK